jgi:hypothetical protein
VNSLGWGVGYSKESRAARPSAAYQPTVCYGQQSNAARAMQQGFDINHSDGHILYRV